MINLITVGKIKEKYVRDGIDDYLKRISKYSKINVIEIPDVAYEKEKTLKIESEAILSKINKKSYIITLEINGNQLNSEQFSELIDKIYINNSDITFIIGGSYGFDKSVSDLANYKLSFSNFTFPHQLFRLIFLEQLYRAFKISNNESYHK